MYGEPHGNDGTIEQRRRKLQLLLGVEWKKRQISKDALGSRGLSFSQADAGSYEAKRKRHEAMKNVEYGVDAENMLLEGADMDGKTEQENPYHWFGDSVMAYPASSIDDVLRGADAILMFIDQEDERLAHPVVIDVKTNREDATARVTDAFEDAIRRGGLSSVYWVDTASEPGSSSFDEPMPVDGKIQALRLALHIPAESAKIYKDESMPAAVADREMRRLGGYVRRQMASQLEAIALLLTGKLSLADVASGELKLSQVMDQKELLDEIEKAMGQGRDRDQILATVKSCLESIWSEQVNNGDSQDPMPEMMPRIIRNLGCVRRTPKAG
jgi:hypothetical protein